MNKTNELELIRSKIIFQHGVNIVPKIENNCMITNYADSMNMPLTKENNTLPSENTEFPEIQNKNNSELHKLTLGKSTQNCGLKQQIESLESNTKIVKKIPILLQNLAHRKICQRNND